MNSHTTEWLTQLGVESYPSSSQVCILFPSRYLEEGNGPHSSTLAWKIPWTEESGGPQSMGSLGVGHDWAPALSLYLLPGYCQVTDHKGQRNSDEDEVMKRYAQDRLTKDLNSEVGPGGGVEGHPWIAEGRPEEEPGGTWRWRGLRSSWERGWGQGGGVGLQGCCPRTGAQQDWWEEQISEWGRKMRPPSTGEGSQEEAVPGGEEKGLNSGWTCRIGDDCGTAEWRRPDGSWGDRMLDLKSHLTCFFFQEMWTLGTSLVAQWLRICLPIQETQVWSLVTALRSHMPWATSLFAAITCMTSRSPQAKTKDPTWRN